MCLPYFLFRDLQVRLNLQHLTLYLQHFTIILRKFSPEKRSDSKMEQNLAHTVPQRRKSHEAEGPGRGAGHQKAMLSNAGAGGLFSPVRLSRGPSLDAASNPQEQRGAALFGQLLSCCDNWWDICCATIKAHAWHIVLIEGGCSSYRIAMFENNEDMLRIWRDYQGPERFYALVTQALNVSPEETGLVPATLVSGLKLYHERSLRIQSMGVLGTEGNMLRYNAQLKVELVSFSCSGSVLPIKGYLWPLLSIINIACHTDLGINHKVDLYCTLWVGAWTSSPCPLEPLLASDFAHPGKVCDGMKTDVANSGEVNPVWRSVASRKVRSREGGGEGGVPNTSVVAWLVNKKLVSLVFLIACWPYKYFAPDVQRRSCRLWRNQHMCVPLAVMRICRIFCSFHYCRRLTLRCLQISC